MFSPDQESCILYYQAQAQLKLCEAAYCDFVMWSEDELLVLRILPDPEFINGVFEEVTSVVLVMGFILLVSFVDYKVILV